MHPSQRKKFIKRDNDIRFLRSKGWTLRAIGERYGLTKQRIEVIANPTRHAERQAKHAQKWKRKSTVVYVVRVHDFVKIGITRNISKRLAGLQAGCPYKIQLLFTVVGGWELEAQLHDRFRASNRWNEWFHLTPEVSEFIEENTREVRV